MAEQYGTGSVILRIAEGPRTGFGHLRRSWTLASRLVEEAIRVCFITGTEGGAAILSEAGFSAVAEEHPNRLDRTLDILRQTGMPKICILDDPEVPAESLAALRELSPVVCVDDTAERDMPVDLVLNGSAGADALAYRGLPQTRYLLGPAYILLRNEFAEEPSRPAVSPDVRRVLVLAGGGCAGMFPQVVAEAVEAVLPSANIDVVAGPFSEVADLQSRDRARVTWHHSPSDIRSLMLAADLAISGGGQTLYELAAAGTPTLGVKMASNQALNLRGMAAAGCLWDLGLPDDQDFREKLERALETMSKDMGVRQAMASRGRSVVDGKGTDRVAAYLKTWLASSGMAREIRACST